MGPETWRNSGSNTWTLWVLLVRLVVYVQLDLQLYYRWSRLGRKLYEKAHFDTVIPPMDTPEELKACMAGRFYRPDPPWHLWDMISCPGRIWSYFMSGLAFGDCDEFGVLAATRLRDLWYRLSQSPRAGEFFPTFAGRRFQCPSLMSIVWLSDDGAVGGHNVCVFQYQMNDGNWYWAYVGNWFGGEVQWTATSSRLMPTLNDVACEVSRLGGGRNVRWARVRASDLKLWETGTAC